MKLKIILGVVADAIFFVGLICVVKAGFFLGPAAGWALSGASLLVLSYLVAKGGRG